MTLRLHYAPDNASLCVRLALEWLGQSYETVLVNRSAKDHKSADYLALNPMGRIPVLETDHGPIFETAAILLWLADLQPTALFPDPHSTNRHLALSWLFWMSNTMHPTLLLLFYPDQYSDAEDGLAAPNRARWHDLVAMMEDRAEILEEIPLLQCYLMPMLRWAVLYGKGDWFDLSGAPKLRALASRFELTPHAQRAIAAEGLGVTAFSRPKPANPPEGRVF